MPTVDLERLDAASRLLGDESLTVRRALLREFRSAGRAGRPRLLRGLRSDDPAIRSHARSLIDALGRDAALRRVYRYAFRDEIDLESGLLLLSHLERPSLDLRPCRAALDEMASEVDSRCAGASDDLDRCKVLVEYLGEELGFKGDMDTYVHPNNVFLHRVIDRRRGLPLTLCALYAFVADRCGLRTGLMPLPGHVMLRLYGHDEELIVDPFHGGAGRSQKSLRAYLTQHGLRFRAVWFRDAPASQLLRRQISNLHNALSTLGHTGRARRLLPLIQQLGRRDG